MEPILAVARNASSSGEEAKEEEAVIEHKFINPLFGYNRTECGGLSVIEEDYHHEMRMATTTASQYLEQTVSTSLSTHRKDGVLFGGVIISRLSTARIAALSAILLFRTSKSRTSAAAAGDEGKLGFAKSARQRQSAIKDFVSNLFPTTPCDI